MICQFLIHLLFTLVCKNVHFPNCFLIINMTEFLIFLVFCIFSANKKRPNEAVFQNSTKNDIIFAGSCIRRSPSISFGGVTLRKGGDCMVTYENLFQYTIMLITLVGICYHIFTRKKINRQLSTLGGLLIKHIEGRLFQLPFFYPQYTISF